MDDPTPRDNPRKTWRLIYASIFGTIVLAAVVVAVQAAVTLRQAEDVRATSMRFTVAAVIALFAAANPIFTAFEHSTSTVTTHTTGMTRRRHTRHSVSARSVWPGVIYLVLTIALLPIGSSLADIPGVTDMVMLPAGGALLLCLQAFGSYLFTRFVQRR